jgi:hypothetical protein
MSSGQALRNPTLGYFRHNSFPGHPNYSGQKAKPAFSRTPNAPHRLAATCFARPRQHHHALQTRHRNGDERGFHFKHLYASAQVDTFRLHGIHNDPHARQGSDYLLGGPAPTTLVKSLHKLKKGAGVTNIGTSAEGTYNPSKACIIRSPRGVGNILSSQIDPLAKQNDGTIYRVLRTFILDSAHQTHLRAQLNLLPTSPLNFTQKSEPGYATLLYDFGMHWLPADLADLYFG